MRHLSDATWERWGQQDPYFGVLAEDKYRKEKIAQNQDGFFESGERHIAEVLGGLEGRFGGLLRGSALDFGCGVGRLLIPLSRRFAHVTGMDISKSMLKEASRNLAARDIGNVELLESDDILSRLASKKFDFIHTFIVLQHIAPKRGYMIVENLLEHLTPGGAFFVHVSVRNMDASANQLSALRKLARFVRGNVPYSYLFLNILMRRKLSEPEMDMNDYDLVRMLQIFKAAGVDKVITELDNQGTYLTARCYSRTRFSEE